MVETLAVSVIVVIVLTGVYSFFRLGQRTYASGTDQINLHHSVRLTAEKVIRHVRFANEVLLLEDWEPESANTERYRYIYFDAENKSVVYLDKEGEQILSTPIISEFTFLADGNTLLFTTKGEYRSSAFTLDSSVTFINFDGHLANPDSPMAIRFNIPEIGDTPDTEGNPLPQSQDPDEEVDLLVVHNEALPTVDKNYPSHSATTIEWERSFEHPITSVEASISRLIEGQFHNNSYQFTGQWTLTLFLNGAPHLIKSEQIRKPTAWETTIKSFEEFIPAHQPIRLVLEIEYGYGGHRNNRVKPEFSDIELKLIFFR